MDHKTAIRKLVDTNMMTRTDLAIENSAIPRLVDTKRAAQILGRSPATLKRWRHQGIGPNFIEIESRVSYDLAVLLEFIRTKIRIPAPQQRMQSRD